MNFFSAYERNLNHNVAEIVSDETISKYDLDLKFPTVVNFHHLFDPTLPKVIQRNSKDLFWVATCSTNAIKSQFLFFIGKGLYVHCRALSFLVRTLLTWTQKTANMRRHTPEIATYNVVGVKRERIEKLVTDEPLPNSLDHTHYLSIFQSDRFALLPFLHVHSQH